MSDSEVLVEPLDDVVAVPSVWAALLGDCAWLAVGITTSRSPAEGIVGNREFSNGLEASEAFELPVADKSSDDESDLLAGFVKTESADLAASPVIGILGEVSATDRNCPGDVEGMLALLSSTSDARFLGVLGDDKLLSLPNTKGIRGCRAISTSKNVNRLPVLASAEARGLWLPLDVGESWNN